MCVTWHFLFVVKALESPITCIPWLAAGLKRDLECGQKTRAAKASSSNKTQKKSKQTMRAQEPPCFFLLLLLLLLLYWIFFFFFFWKVLMRPPSHYCRRLCSERLFSIIFVFCLVEARSINAIFISQGCYCWCWVRNKDDTGRLPTANPDETMNRRVPSPSATAG